jgi:hypothetical protein
MRRKWIFVLAPLGIAVFIFVGGEVVEHLWNWLAPTLFGWRPVTFWQAVGLLALSRILFGGFSRGGGMRRSMMRRRIAEKWDRMTPEEREKFCGGMHGRWRREETEAKPGA